jgi:hypothetical protein
MNVAPLRLVFLGINPLIEKCSLYIALYLVSMYKF